MKNLIVISLLALCVSCASAQFTSECMSSITTYGLWTANCASSLTFNFDQFSSVTTFCGASGQCGLSQFASLAANVITQCGGFYTGAQRAQLISMFQMLEGYCLNVNGHYCLQDALTLSELLGEMNLENTSSVKAVTDAITSTCSYGCGAKLYKLAMTYGNTAFEDMNMAFLATSMLCTSAGTDNCFTKFLTFLGASTSNPPNWAVVSSLICDPCIRKLSTYKTFFSGSPFAEYFDYVPDFTAVCQMNNESKSCGKVIVDLVSSLDLMTKCSAGATAPCLLAASNLISSAGCCTRSLLPLLSPAQAAIFSAIPGMPDVCKPAKASDAKLTVTLNLGGVNVTRLNGKWDSIKTAIAAEFAAQVVVDVSDVAVSLSITGGVAKVTFTIELSTTVYSSSTLAALINPMISSGSLQFSTLNNDAALATSTSGVTVASGQAGDGAASTFSISSAILGFAALSLAAL